MRIIIAILFASSALGSIITSGGSGNWNSTTPNAPWPGGVIPGNGDTVIIGAGQTITIPAGYHAIIGVSGPGGVQQTGGGPVPAIQCASEQTTTAILVINGTLTFRGNIEQCTALWTVGPDAILEHDSSLASSPSTTHYRWFIGVYLFPDAARLNVRGTLGHRAIVRNAVSSGTFYGFTINRYGGTGQADFEYASIDGCGGSTPCMNVSSHATGNAWISRCDHCLVTNSGYWNIEIGNTGGPLNVGRITNSSFTLSADPNSYITRIVCNSAADIVLDTIFTTGRLYMPCSGNTNATGTHGRNIVIVNDFAGAGQYPIVLAGGFRIGEFDRIMRITDTLGGSSTGTPGSLPGGVLTRLMCLMNSNLNPHCFSGPAGDSIANDAVNGAYLEKIGTGQDGDGFLGGPVGATITTLQNIVSTCSTTDGYSMGTLNNITGASPGKILALNNTVCGKEPSSAQGVGLSSEITNIVAGQQSARDNLVYCATNTNCYLVHQGPTGTPAAGAYLNMDYNWKWNVSVGPYFNVGAMYSPNPPGSHDSSGDPQFVQQRHVLQWCQMLKPSISTWSDCVAEFAKMNDDSGYDQRFTILNAYTWLMAGYQPQNAAVLTAGDTGGQVGVLPLLPSELDGPAKVKGPSFIK